MTSSPDIWDLIQQYAYIESTMSCLANAWNMLDAIKLSRQKLNQGALKHLNDAVESTRLFAGDINSMREQLKSKLYDATHERKNNE